MSLQTHLTVILDKALAAKARAEAAISLVGQVQTLENENRMTPQIEADLEPYLETVGAATVPDAAEYEALDDALESAENICKNA